ncbi:hypothetical protein Hte_012248 [Hypoxylon texense]
MSGLNKKSSVMFAQPTGAHSPTGKSEQGGVRLDAGLDDIGKAFDQLSLKNTPVRETGHSDINSPKVGHMRKNSPIFGYQLRVASDDVFSTSPAGDLDHQLEHGATLFGRADHAPPMQAVYPTLQGRVLRSRATYADMRSQVGNVDAQAHYPPEFCAFVANLPEQSRDVRLEAEVTRVFSGFGPVFVKIRRDKYNHPYAFCQFTREEDFKNALANGKGMLIDGRPCRVEQVKANCSFVMFKLTSNEVSAAEARNLAASFGPVAKCEALHRQIQEAMGTKGGVLVEFAKFDPGRDIVAAFRYDPVYRVVPYDLKKAAKKPKVDPDEAWLQKYEVDRRSIFVGNLPAGIDNLEEYLTEITSEIGVVEKVQIVRKDATRGSVRGS